jgi:hypothetical protein
VQVAADQQAMTMHAAALAASGIEMESEECDVIFLDLTAPALPPPPPVLETLFALDKEAALGANLRAVPGLLSDVAAQASSAPTRALPALRRALTHNTLQTKLANASLLVLASFVYRF